MFRACSLMTGRFDLKSTQRRNLGAEKLWGNCGGDLQKPTERGVYWRTP
jgi:hypothetical protein